MTYPIRSIVVGVAEEDASDAALDAAVEMARRTGATLHAVHAFPLPALFTLSPAIDYVDPKGLNDFVDMVRRGFESRVAARHPGMAIECHAVPGAPHRAIAETMEAVDADLVVVGPTHRGRVGRVVLGTTAQRVLREGRCPVLLVRTVPVAARRVLIATDLTPASATVHDRGMDLVEALFPTPDAELRALLVLVPSLAQPPLSKESLDRAVATEMADYLSLRSGGTLTPTPRIRHGLPASEIAAEAEEWGADLLVVGTHARVGPARWILGSVAEATVRDAPCNVLVVPPTAAEAG